MLRLPLFLLLFALFALSSVTAQQDPQPDPDVEETGQEAEPGAPQAEGTTPTGAQVSVDAGTEGRIELRPVTLPDGSEVTLYVITGNPVRITIDDDQIEADHIEFDQTNNLMRIIGFGRYTAEGTTTEGRDFVVELDDEMFDVSNVFITTEAIDVVGVDATRFPGQIDVAQSRFSPCARCGQETEDYSFRAGRLRLHPGDRLIAWDVEVMIRDLPVFFLPLMVVPLGPQDRQPRLRISQGETSPRGSDFTRAEIAADLPYVVGANAYGFTSLRYYADVLPGQGGFFGDLFLGGGAETSYFGGGVVHNFFSEQGEGVLEFNYLPSFITSAQRGPLETRNRDEIRYRFQYDVLDELVALGETPDISILIERDDNRRQRLTEYSVSFGNVVEPFDITLLTQGYIDAEPGRDPLLRPSYAGSGSPDRSFTRITVEPQQGVTFGVGPFNLSNFLLDLGAFEDISNPTNPRVLGERATVAARALERHTLTLAPLEPWTGFSLRGTTAFQGQYYSSGERLIRWNTNLGVGQSFGELGSLNVTITRNVTEGETPFSFDRLTPSFRTDVSTVLSLTPFPWLSLDVREVYTIADDRSFEELGPGPIDSTVRFFGNLPWIDLTLRNSYDVQENNPGNLDATLNLTTQSDTFAGRLTLNHTQNLDPTNPANIDEFSGADDTSTNAVVDLSYPNFARLEARTGVNYNPGLPSDGVAAFYDPLELALSLGTLSQSDGVPGARFGYRRDINLGAPEIAELQFAARVDPFELLFDQRLDFVNQRTSPNSRYRLTWRGVASFEATGFSLLPPQWVGLIPETAETWTFTLQDELRPTGSALYSVTYQTTYDPNLETLAGTIGGFSNSQINAFLNAAEVDFGDIQFSLDVRSLFRLADDTIAISYLQNAEVIVASDFYGVVGVQGRVEYTSEYNAAIDEFTRSTVRIDDLRFSVRVLEDVFVAAEFRDVWEFGNPPGGPFGPFFQPLIYVTWDRCCWALYGSYDTRSGAIAITLTTPGNPDEGVTIPGQGPFTLPGRDPFSAPPVP